MLTLKEQLKENLKKGTLYDFMSSNGYKFSKEELIDIIKNLDFAIDNLLGEDTCTQVENETINTLEDYDFWNEE